MYSSQLLFCFGLSYSYGFTQLLFGLNLLQGCKSHLKFTFLFNSTFLAFLSLI